MDGVSEDFSGLPEHQSRRERREKRREERFAERRANPYRGRRTRVLLVGGFALALLLLTISLIALYAPTPYLGTSHGALANSIGGASAQGCHPAGGSWICSRDVDGTLSRYSVKVDWAGCWNGQMIGSPAASTGADRKISGCVSIVDHLTAG